MFIGCYRQITQCSLKTNHGITNCEKQPIFSSKFLIGRFTFSLQVPPHKESTNEKLKEPAFELGKN
jgi:hypothetical protein